MTYRCLIIDDDAAMRTALTDLFSSVGWDVDTAYSGKDGLTKIAASPPDAVVSDVRMPGMTGLEMLTNIDTNTAPPIILISAHGDIPMAVEAMQLGAYTFLEKPYDPRRLLSATTHAAEQHHLRRTTGRLKKQLSNLSGLDQRMIGQTEAMDRLREDIVDFADLGFPVLVQGETGSGKELAANALHDLSSRAAHRFHIVNCAALDADGFDRLSNDSQTMIGTLFLDGITACPTDTQAKLLRMIEALETASPQNLRIVASCSTDVEQDVAEGRLREDLYFRLSSLTLSLPALRDRRDDITLLFTHFADDYAQAHDIPRPDLTPDDLKVLLGHDWPGNVRELRNAALRYTLLSRRGDARVSAALSSATPDSDTPTTLRAAVASFERQMIARALENATGTMDDVAADLGIGRRTLNEKIVKLGLDR